MTILDRYIIRQFLINFLILVFVLMSFYVLVDLIFNLDEFLEAGRVRAARWAAPPAVQPIDAEAGAASTTTAPAAPAPKSKPGAAAVFAATLWSIADFYGPLVLLVYVFQSGLLVVGAMGFTLASLARSRELVAIVTSGVSMYRIAAPVLVAGCLLNALTLPDQELLIPHFADKLARKRSQVRYDSIETFAVQYAPDGTGNLLSAASFDPQGQELKDVVILDRDAKGQAVRRITASQALWDDARHGWDLNNGYAIYRQVGDNAFSAPPISAPEAQSFFATDLSPQVLLARRAEIYPALLSLRELGRLLNNPAADTRRIGQIMHSRFSLMIVNVLVLVMGLPFFLLREPANLLVQTVKAAAVCLAAWGGGVVMLQFDFAQLPPVVAAWLPVVVYLPIAAVLLQWVKT